VFLNSSGGTLLIGGARISYAGGPKGFEEGGLFMKLANNSYHLLAGGLSERLGMTKSEEVGSGLLTDRRLK
jgi:hypothetical protein